jgi:hypothetical protein
MKTSLTSTTSTTIDLSGYFFDGPVFNWQNIAVTLAEWPNPQWTDEEHSADITTDIRDLFWLRYKDIELFFGLEDCTTVVWHQAVWIPEDPRGFCVTTPNILPKDPGKLLQLLGLTSHPEAGDIAQFWVNLQKFLPFLSAFMQNVAWPDPNLMKLL